MGWGLRLSVLGGEITALSLGGALRLCLHNCVVLRGAVHPQQPQLVQLQLTALSTSLGSRLGGGWVGADGGILVFQWLWQGQDCQ